MIVLARTHSYVTAMPHLSVHDLRTISADAICSLDGPTPVKAGECTVGILIPLKVADRWPLEAVLLEAERLAAERDPAEDEKLLAEFGDVDLTIWSIEAVRRLRSETP